MNQIKTLAVITIVLGVVFVATLVAIPVVHEVQATSQKDYNQVTGYQISSTGNNELFFLPWHRAY
jgi:hypothetical protein